MSEDRGAAPARPGGAPANDPGDGPEEGVEPEAATPEDQLAAVEVELAETKDRLLRALAETENVRRRFQREREDAQKYAISGFAKDLLTVVDNLRRAPGAMPAPRGTHPRTPRPLHGRAAAPRGVLAAVER